MKCPSIVASKITINTSIGKNSLGYQHQEVRDLCLECGYYVSLLMLLDLDRSWPTETRRNQHLGKQSLIAAEFLQKRLERTKVFENPRAKLLRKTKPYIRGMKHALSARAYFRGLFVTYTNLIAHEVAHRVPPFPIKSTPS